MAGETRFLTFNRDSIFRNLLATEEHFRNVEGRVESEGFMGCIVKHLALAEDHADEAVSHALVAEGKEVSGKFARLRDGLRALRSKVQQGSISPSDGIRETRTLRESFGDVNPGYSTKECKACGGDEPTLGAFRQLKEQKNLNILAHNNNSDETMSGKAIGLVYGSDHVAKGLTRGFVEVDRYTGKIAEPPHLRPSTWLNLGLGVGLPLLTMFVKKIKDPWDKVLIGIGGFTSTKIWDYAEEYIPAAGGASVGTPVYVQSSGSSISVTTPRLNGKYQMVA